MARLIYPSLQQPVLTQSQQAEAVTEDRWHQPLSEPVGTRIKNKTAAEFAARVASGLYFYPFPLTGAAENVFYDKWAFPLSEPVRIPPRLNTGSQPFHGFVQATPFPETVNLDKYYMALSEPVRQKVGLRADLHMTYTNRPFTPTELPVLNIGYIFF